MASTLLTRRFGPFTKGVIETGNPSLALDGALRSAAGVTYAGAGKLATRSGATLALTLKDDAGTPADVTSVRAIVPFGDGALAVAHSTVTDKVYLYRLTAALDDWYDATGALQGTASPEPVAVLWTSVTTAPDVLIAEGLGVAYLAHTEPVVGSTLTFPSKSFTPPGTVATLTSNLDGSGGAEDLYFAGVLSFQQHLWAWGFGSGTTGATGYRPELARYSQPNFATSPALFLTADSITLGARVRSEREKIVGGGLAGESLYLGGQYQLTRITGYGRDSWFRQPVDQSHGFAGPKCMVSVADVLYYWSPRGPMRIGAQGAPDPLWDRLGATAAAVLNPQTAVASYDDAADCVVWAVDTGAGVRTQVRYDVRRDAWLGPDDWGLGVGCAGTVAPLTASSASVSYAPAGPPTTAVTGSIGATSAVASWTTGDATAQTQVEVRQQGTTMWSVRTTTLAAGVTSYTLTDLTAGTAYEWRAAHSKGGTLSAYLGPVAGSQFTTSAASTLSPPTALEAHEGETTLYLSWTNAGEAGAGTDIFVAGPAVSEPLVYTLLATKAPGVASHTVAPTEGNGVYWFKVRHVLGTGTSAFTASDSAQLGPAV